MLFRSAKPRKKLKPLKVVSGLEAESQSPIESLDDWQQQFINFITYPSDHIVTATGTKVPWRQTEVWGRQKEIWTGPMMKQLLLPQATVPLKEEPSVPPEEEPSKVQSSNVVVNCSETMNTNDFSHKPKRYNRGEIPAKAGGNHLSQQLVVQAALATAQLQQQQKQLNKTESDQKKEDVSTGNKIGDAMNCTSNDELLALDEFTDFKTAATTSSIPIHKKKKRSSKPSTVLMIRRNEEQALWFHGGTTMNQDLGEWLQHERESFREDLRKTFALGEATASLTKHRLPNSRREHGNDTTNRAFLSGIEMNERYERFQRSFQYNLLQMIGLDLHSVRPDATMFRGKYYKEENAS